jgi:hypothetical protein
MAKKVFPRLNFDKMQPYALQREIIECEVRFKAVAFGRQSGKSWLAKRVALKAAANDGKRVWWVAPTMTVAADHWADLVKLITDIGFPTAKVNNSTKTIEFLSGGSIRIRSAEIPDNLRGGTLDVLILDEAAFMREEVWSKILMATITASRGTVLFLSTPNGQNWFYRLFMMGQNPKYQHLYRSWQMPSTEAPYQDKELLEIIRQTTPAMVWREEYMAEFLADSGGVFAGLDAVEFQPMLYRPIPGRVYVAGIDWGMDEDYTVFTVGDKYERRQVYGVRFNTIGTLDQVERIKEELEIWKPEVVHIEKNGVGVPMFRLLREQLGSHAGGTDRHGNFFLDSGRTKIRGVHMDNRVKRRIIERLAADIEWKRYTPLIREDEQDLDSFGAIQMSEMSTFERKRTAMGLDITYSAMDGHHDDTVMGQALMYMGMDEYEDPDAEVVKADHRSVPRSTKRSPFRRPMPSVRVESGRENTRMRRRARSH